MQAEVLVAFFNTRRHDRALQAIYRRIPPGECSQCPRCCYDNVPLSAVEFVSILDALQKDIERFHTAVEQWYLEQYRRVQPCLFLEGSRCQIYPVRPLACRLFGHQSNKEQLKRAAVARQSKRVAAKTLFKEYGITVSRHVVNHAIMPCDFKAEDSLSKLQANQLFDEITALSSLYYRRGLIEHAAINMTLIEWLLLYDHDETALFERLVRNSER